MLCAGCIALKAIEEKICEMKRLYVKKEYRRLEIGKGLMDRCISYAKEQEYEIMRLETLPGVMDNAIKMYLSKGFVKKELKENVLIMEKKL